MPVVDEHPIRFENLTNVDGLSQVSALAITQDRKGFVWIGTEDGLNRYDGYRFRIFRHRPDDPDASLAWLTSVSRASRRPRHCVAIDPETNVRWPWEATTDEERSGD